MSLISSVNGPKASAPYTYVADWGDGGAGARLERAVRIVGLDAGPPVWIGKSDRAPVAAGFRGGGDAVEAVGFGIGIAEIVGKIAA